jgi:DNA-binding NarL/FixJ family response regulator
MKQNVSGPRSRIRSDTFFIAPSDGHVVVLTSSHAERDMIRSYRLGVNAYVVKPVDFLEFVNAVKELGVFWAVIKEPPPGSMKRVR